MKEIYNKDILLFFDTNKENILKRFFKKFYNFLFEFHDYKFFLNKKFMLTPCSHVYHSICMERWIKHKNECPIDRFPLNQIEYSYYN